MRAGQMDHRFALEQPFPMSNGQGGTEQGWTVRHQCWAEVIYLRGGEVVQAARLAGKQPAVVKIRRCTDVAALDTSWRLRDLRSGTIWNIRAIVPTKDRAGLELTCESGVAV
jgi:head-tail adaptor